MLRPKMDSVNNMSISCLTETNSTPGYTPELLNYEVVLGKVVTKSYHDY